jgi:hypothetical protein
VLSADKMLPGAGTGISWKNVIIINLFLKLYIPVFKAASDLYIFKVKPEIWFRNTRKSDPNHIYWLLSEPPIRGEKQGLRMTMTWCIDPVGILFILEIITVLYKYEYI